MKFVCNETNFVMKKILQFFSYYYHEICKQKKHALKICYNGKKG